MKISRIFESINKIKLNRDKDEKLDDWHIYFGIKAVDYDKVKYDINKRENARL